MHKLAFSEKMERMEIIKWLLKGDVSIQYQVHRDLLSIERNDLQNKIAKEGFGAKFLSKRNPNGHWGLKFYQPKSFESTYHKGMDNFVRCKFIAIDDNQARYEYEFVYAELVG